MPWEERGGGMRAENEARAAGLEGAGDSGGAIYSGGMTSALDSGVTRDEDGVDRVPDPPDSLKPILYDLQKICEVELIDLHRQLEQAGGLPFGTMQVSKFASALVVLFNRYDFTDTVIRDIISAYGCG